MLYIPSLKYKTKQSPVQTIRDPADFYLSLHAYGNHNLKPVVSIGEQVLKYQCIAISEGTFASTLHAPVSGVIKAMIDIEGIPHLQLENDFEQMEIETAPIDHSTLNAANFSTFLMQYGIEGAGGSRFPTQLKYQLNETPIHTLIFNGVECEPYLSADAILMQRKPQELLKAASFMQQIFDIKRIVFVLEKQNQDITKILKKAAQELGIQVTFCTVPDSYPQGGELQVIKAVAGIEIKKGDIPSRHGILLNNVGTLWAIYQALYEGKPFVERITTLSGDKSRMQGNYQLKIGTSLAHLIRETQQHVNLAEHIVILGGAMMGKKVDPANAYIHKGAGGVLLLKEQKQNAANCIKCGACVDVCPQHLMPLEFVRYAAEDQVEKLQSYHLPQCIECGACSYICPSDVPLMESIFHGKKLLQR
ncbi:electron transport complex subunit RsxC [Sphingobacterium sp. LRF_L2]|uniref:electron transport complex subunit RsxC n=1 Tax=Sphingobacterium sp. LRF_L2 TaxID=3369421 RepID=UPI003F622E29